MMYEYGGIRATSDMGTVVQASNPRSIEPSMKPGEFEAQLGYCIRPCLDEGEKSTPHLLSGFSGKQDFLCSSGRP